MSLNNSNVLVKQYLQLEAKIAPLKAEQDLLKLSIRDLGKGNYPIDKLGYVEVSAASEPRLKGTELMLTDKFTALPLKLRSSLQAQGVVKLENIYTKPRVASVSATLL